MEKTKVTIPNIWSTTAAKQLLQVFRKNLEKAEAASKRPPKVKAIASADTEFGVKDDARPAVPDPTREFVPPPPIEAPPQLPLQIGAVIGSLMALTAYVMFVYNIIMYGTQNDYDLTAEDPGHVDWWCVTCFGIVGVLIIIVMGELLHRFYYDIQQGRIESVFMRDRIASTQYYVGITGLNRAGKMTSYTHQVDLEVYVNAHVGNFIDLRAEK